ncbi:DNA methyltransferase C1 [Alteromonas sp. KUL156]|nr:DNA methyltransferase C1 [Alteromonas sp. KUL154]GFE01716.1 DNA methyltransferase C1 [Alteromonas sp. KUL156]
MEERKKHKETTINLINEYSKNEYPIEVNFRELVNKNFQDRATHIIHPYPAKLLSNIPYFFLNNDFFTSKGDNVLDPFSGSGTVMLESSLAGMNSFGSDANPLARLISKVKTSSYDLKTLNKLKKSLIEEVNKHEGVEIFPDVVNIDYWFFPNVKRQLNSILIAINGISSKKYKDFFLLCFSNCIKKVSLADSRVSVPVKIKAERYPVGNPFRKKSEKKLDSLKTINVYNKFFEIVDSNIKRFENKKNISSYKCSSKIISDDARKLKLKDASIDLIISSPPYAGAQKYIRASSLNLGWTNLSKASELKTLDKKNIGRENYTKSEYITLKQTGILDADLLLKRIYEINPQRAHIAANYLIEMESAIKESIRVLKPKKYLILVAANNKVCNLEFKTQDYLRQIAEKHGMKTECRLIDDIKSYGLMTKRNKTASIITCEWVLIMKKK